MSRWDEVSVLDYVLSTVGRLLPPFIGRALLQEFFKQNFKVKCESSDTKDITWQYSFVNSLYMKACCFVESESF
jgi:hypothetical protein